MMQTKHTEIIPQGSNRVAPTTYHIVGKESRHLINVIKFQEGAVDDTCLNGIFLEDLLLICINQIEHFQASEFRCKENEATLRHLYDALATTRARQYERMLRGVQGRNKI